MFLRYIYRGEQTFFSQIAYLPEDYGCVHEREIDFDDMPKKVQQIFKLDTLEEMLKAGIDSSEIEMKHVDENELRPIPLKVEPSKKTIGTSLQSTAIPETPKSFREKWGM